MRKNIKEHNALLKEISALEAGINEYYGIECSNNEQAKEMQAKLKTMTVGTREYATTEARIHQCLKTAHNYNVLGNDLHRRVDFLREQL
ncbi:MAG: hypothetical protein MJ245_05920 [Clostridia bacterium]|nr:hypothetical protein [Clostridia bacterium]